MQLFRTCWTHRYGMKGWDNLNRLWLYNLCFITLEWAGSVCRGSWSSSESGLIKPGLSVEELAAVCNLTTRCAGSQQRDLVGAELKQFGFRSEPPLPQRTRWHIRDPEARPGYQEDDDDDDASSHQPLFWINQYWLSECLLPCFPLPSWWTSSRDLFSL